MNANFGQRKLASDKPVFTEQLVIVKDNPYKINPNGSDSGQFGSKICRTDQLAKNSCLLGTEEIFSEVYTRIKVHTMDRVNTSIFTNQFHQFLT